MDWFKEIFSTALIGLMLIPVILILITPYILIVSTNDEGSYWKNVKKRYLKLLFGWFRSSL
jgi:hypothetical protein